VKLLFAELGRTPENDQMCSINYDGSFNRHADSLDHNTHHFTTVGGTKLSETKMRTYFEKEIKKTDLSLNDAIQRAALCWQLGFSTPAHPDKFEREALPSQAELKKLLRESLKNRRVEAALLNRNSTSASCFQRLDEKAVQKAIKNLE
jgi:hypothetical protein